VTSITAEEAAQRLGVKRETLYAYVSRGLLSSRRAAGRESLFDAAEVERLAGRRGSRRRTGEMDVPVESAVTLLEPSGRLSYRGFDAAELARTASFEEVAELLWSGGREVRGVFDAPAALRSAARRAAASLPGSARPVDRIRVAVAAAAVADPLRYDRSAEGVAAAGRRMLLVEADAAGVPGRHAGAGGRGRDNDGGGRRVGSAGGRRVDGRLGRAGSPGGRRDGGGGGPSIAERLWFALSGRSGAPDEVGALDAALVLLADHELASSTLAARVAASTWADPYLVVSAGLAAAGGPLHASMGDRVAGTLHDAVASGAAAAVAERWRLGEEIAGFGHAVYRELDPRAEALWPFLARAWPGHPVLEVSADIAGLVRTSFRNVDLALGALVACAGMSPGSAEAIFVVARTAGWLAHAAEEYAHRLRYRVRAAYTGRLPSSPA
jgi:citrate synthase